VDSTCEDGTILGVVDGNQLEDNARKCEPGDAETPATVSWNASRSVRASRKFIPPIIQTMKVVKLMTGLLLRSFLVQNEEVHLIAFVLCHFSIKRTVVNIKVDCRNNKLDCVNKIVN